MKLNIFFENSWSELGILAKSDFYNIVSPNQEFADTVQVCTEKFMEDLRKMPTFTVGFTEEYKIKFISLFEENINKKFILIDDWIINKGLREKYMEVVVLINQGKTLQEATKIINEKFKLATENV